MPKILQNTRENILKESKALLLSTSYSDFNIRDIAKSCNISVGTIYNNFINKHDLILAVFNEDWSKSLEKLQSINTDYSSIYEKLKALHGEMNVFISTFINILRELSNQSVSSGQPSYLDSLHEVIINILEYERKIGNVTSNLSNEKLSVFILSVLMNLCNDKSLSFDEAFSLIKFN